MYVIYEAEFSQSAYSLLRKRFRVENFLSLRD
jgi:hypothetical protein